MLVRKTFVLKEKNCRVSCECNSLAGESEVSQKCNRFVRECSFRMQRNRFTGKCKVSCGNAIVLWENAKVLWENKGSQDCHSFARELILISLYFEITFLHCKGSMNKLQKKWGRGVIKIQIFFGQNVILSVKSHSISMMVTLNFLLN